MTEEWNQNKYWDDNHRVGQYGVKYLDDVLCGISRSDLVVIGARSGAGKSSLAETIYRKNCNDYICALFSLENFDGDIRSKSNWINYKKITGQSINERQWQLNEFKVDWEALKQAEEKTKQFFANKKITTRQADFSIDKLCDEMTKACKYDEAKLIILDHLDYIDKENPNENDVSHITKLMRKIRELQDIYRVGVVAVSHLKKPESRNNNVIIPNENEFIGSSNKIKEATHVIMIAPDDESNQNETNDDLKRTWFCIRKNRFGGVDNKVANIVFDKRTNSYNEKYDLFSVNYTGTDVKPIQKIGGYYE